MSRVLVLAAILCGCGLVAEAQLRQFGIRLSAPTAGGGGGDPVESTRLPFGGTWQGIVGVRDVDPATRTKHNVSTANGGDDATGTMQTTATRLQIEAALAAAETAGGDRYVELEAGTFAGFTTDTLWDNSGVTLRGQVDGNGQPTTILEFAEGAEIGIRKTAFNYDSSASWGGTNRTVSSGFTRGSSTVTLSATTGLSVGGLLWFSAAANDDIDGDGGFTDWYPDDGDLPFTQVVKVTAIDGSDVTFTPPINADYVTGTIGAHYKTLASQIEYFGLENVKVVNATGYFDENIIEVDLCNQCWFGNIWTVGAGDNNAPGLNVHIYFKGCYGCQLTHSQMSGAIVNSSSQYALGSVHSSGLLVVNNWFHDLPNIWAVLTTSGSVYAYNYAADEPYELAIWQSQGWFYHGSHCHYNLVEGNWLYTMFHDESNAGNRSHSRNTVVLRNRLVGWDANGDKNANTHAITLQDHHDNFSVAGNVMGTSGKQTDYDDPNEDGGTTGESAFGYIWNIHSVSNSTLQRLGNYNTIDGGVRAAETTALNGGTIQDSYLYSSKPAWFGNRPWPWVDPGNYAQSNDPENFPGGYRAMNGTDPP